MKKILGLDLGTTSIGWALVNESENEKEESSIIKTGVRVVPLSTDEINNFDKVNAETSASFRTSKRGARRNLQRYKQRRKVVLEILKRMDFISNDDSLAENFKNSTHHLLKVRAIAPTEKISKIDFARVLVAINKKRGYKSSRKANNQEEGELIDGMAIAKRLQNEKLTPGQLSYELLKSNKKFLPTYYKSDLKSEFKAIWNHQSKFHNELLTSKNYEELENKNKTATQIYFSKIMNIERAEIKGKRDEKKLQEYHWRKLGLTEKLELPKIAYILTEINNQINQSSGYLGEISDRSKELYFKNLTVGQYLYNQIKKNPHQSLKNQVFYRQDYMDEFNAIWEEQSKHYSELTEDLKTELFDITIFYQRRLKSQKGLINTCELESKEITVNLEGRRKRKSIGPKVAPKSSPIFQTFKVWSNINAIRVVKKDNSKTEFHLHDEDKKELFEELNWSASMSESAFLKWLFNSKEEKATEYEIKFGQLEGNRTNAALLKAYENIAIAEGYDNINFKKEKFKVISDLKKCFDAIGIDNSILDFNINLEPEEISKQPSYELWHLLYSYEDDNSVTGIEGLNTALKSKFGFKDEHLPFLINITFQDDYGRLSAKAMRKMIPFLEDGLVYSAAASAAGYNHSNSLTKEENDKRPLKKHLEILKKNSLRNPVVEKILNQMINVVNAIIDDENLGTPDEIRVELARDLKKTAEQRNEATKYINRVTKEHEQFREIIKSEFGLPYVSRRDLIKYKLYRELKAAGYRTLYSGTYIAPQDLFTNKFDIEHILPQSLLFDDSFSNKTLELREVNIEKGNETAIDYCERKGWLDDFQKRTEEVFKDSDGIGYKKRQKLYTKLENLPKGFIERDKNNTGYISKKALEILKDVARNVHSTSGSITSKLRSDWELIDVLKELNWNKYEQSGLTYYVENKEGKKLPKIKDWTKRNDHRHHAMDAITVAFTKPAFIQYLNNKHAKSKGNKIIENIEKKHTYRDKLGGRKFKKPFENIRTESKKHLSEILVSFKAKNKVTTSNVNTTKIKGGTLKKIQLTPRGQLHQETIYGSSKEYIVKQETINAKFDENKIKIVTNPEVRELLLSRFRESGNDPKQAFTGKNSLSKNPIILSNGAEMPLKTKTATLENRFTIRKPITPDLKIDKVVDEGIKAILQKRLDDFNGNTKLAFANLEDNPIWLLKPNTNDNNKHGIQIKRVTITGVNNAVSLHESKDLNGNIITDKNGENYQNDYVSLGNNHAVAIYEDEKGNLSETVISFFDAVTKKVNDLPVIQEVNELGHQLKFTMKQNEMFLIPSDDFDPKTYDLKNPSNNSIISERLFRVQKIANKNYMFRHHLETELLNEKSLRNITWEQFQSLGYLENLIKVRINHLGQIVHIGEY